LDHGNYSWAGESVTRKTRILKVVYNSTNNELVRTNTLVKGSIIQIDSTPFKAWYLQYYNVDLSNKKAQTQAKAAAGKKDTKKDEKATGKKDATKKDEKTTGKKDTTKKDDKSAKKDTTKKDDKTAKKDTTKKDDKSAAAKDKPKPSGDKAKVSKGKVAKKVEDTERTDLNKKAQAKFAKRNSTRSLESGLADQFKTGRVYAKITSRPGQSGRCDGYILEGEELAFYVKKMNLKKKK